MEGRRARRAVEAGRDPSIEVSVGIEISEVVNDRDGVGRDAFAGAQRVKVDLVGVVDRTENNLTRSGCRWCHLQAPQGQCQPQARRG